MLARPPAYWQRSSGHENSRFLEVSGLRVRYVGPGATDAHAACIRASEPAAEAFFYFEVEVVSRGRSGFIGVPFGQLASTYLAV